MRSFRRHFSFIVVSHDAFEHLVAAALVRHEEPEVQPGSHTVIEDYITQNPSSRRCTYWIGIHFAIDAPSRTKDILASASDFRTIAIFSSRREERVIYTTFAVSLFF